MSFVRIYVHIVWATKRREHFLSEGVRAMIVEHIKQNAKVKGIYIDRLNGYTDHLHCLAGLNADMSISKLVQLLKGESAYWINKQRLFSHKFSWAEDYYAVSVSESAIDKVRSYIDTQSIHHKKVTYQEECEAFIRKYLSSNGG